MAPKELFEMQLKEDAHCQTYSPNNPEKKVSMRT